MGSPVAAIDNGQALLEGAGHGRLVPGRGSPRASARWWVSVAASLPMVCLALTTVAKAANVGQPLFNPANGHTYLLLPQTDWTGAQISALALGGTLATITDAAEQDFVYQNFAAGRTLWLGGVRDPQAPGISYRWLNQDPWGYTRWYPGEPNGGDYYQGYLTLYATTNPGASYWNDDGPRVADAGGNPMHGVVEIDPAGPAFDFLLTTNSQWKALAPVGNLEGSSFATAGIYWEVTHPGWNSNPDFDDSLWAPATPLGQSVWGPAPNTPVYLRREFFLPGRVKQAWLIGSVDDDAIVYLNGWPEIAEVNGSYTEFLAIEPKELRPGNNLFAVKAHDSFGVAENFRLALFADLYPLGDATEDDQVGAADYVVWAASFGATGSPADLLADFNFDGQVGAADYAVWAANFGARGRGAAAAVPEPASGLLALAAVVLGLAWRYSRGRRAQ